MDEVAVPVQYATTLNTRFTLYKAASTSLRPFYRTLLQNTLTACTPVVNDTADPDYPATAPEGWEFKVAPDTVSLYPGVTETDDGLRLVYPESA